ncbi:MAG TPA: hypothetical protein VGK21_06240, partial [Candidatus Angelobacter sp.]
FTQLKTTGSQTERELLHLFYLRERYYLSTRRIDSCTRCKLSLTIAKELLISALVAFDLTLNVSGRRFTG